MPESSKTWRFLPNRGVRGRGYATPHDEAHGHLLELARSAFELAARVGHNKATAALANKLARYAWAVATRDRDFEVHAAAA